MTTGRPVTRLVVLGLVWSAAELFLLSREAGGRTATLLPLALARGVAAAVAYEALRRLFMP